MIKLDAIHIENFRGIKRLDLDFQRRSFGIHGPNGSGKSGVVDAIEFALTGAITRLSGQGTAGLTVAQHGPHVDSRDDPASALVRLGVFVPSLGCCATIERRVDRPKKPVITPDAGNVRDLFQEVASHPELALSRREIVKYVLTEPGKRAKEVQALLRLDSLSDLRGAFSSTANKLKKEHEAVQAEVDAAIAELRVILAVDSAAEEDLLRGVNRLRANLGGQDLPAIGPGTDLRTVPGATKGTEGNEKNLDKRRLEAELSALTASLTASPADRDLVRLLEEARRHEGMESALREVEFLEGGLDLLHDATCPFCDSEWDPEALRANVERRLSLVREARDLEQKALSAASGLRARLRRAAESLAFVAAAARLLGEEGREPRLLTFQAELEGVSGALATLPGMLEHRESVEAILQGAPDDIEGGIAKLRAKVEQLPDVSEPDRLRETLAIAQDRFERYHAAIRRVEAARHRASHAARALKAFDDATETVLSGLYASVADTFARYYQALNREDESAFTARLTQDPGKLDLSVDFFQRGQFPPAAYHSEGHQDGMGLCLYLALMRKVLGDRFGFAVLDDVVMSVDRHHRKELCTLLKDEFPDTQFIITTHDDAWQQQMRSAGFITGRAFVNFRRWTLEGGPLVSESEDVWAEIGECLADERIDRAAAVLRRYLEYVASELGDRLRARVPFRGDADYDLGDLLPAVVSRFGDLLRSGKDAAQSWEKRDVQQAIQALHDTFRERLAATQVEQWAINKGLHYSHWANLQRQDFRPVVGAFRDLLKSFRCTACGAWLRLSPSRGPADSLRCDCGDVFLSLAKKP